MSNRKKLFSDASCSSMTPRHHCMLASQREIQRRRWTTAWYTHTVFWASPKRRHSTELTSPDQYATSSWMDGATLQIHSTKGKGMVVCTFTKPALGNSRSRDGLPCWGSERHGQRNRSAREIESVRGDPATPDPTRGIHQFPAVRFAWIVWQASPSKNLGLSLFKTTCRLQPLPSD